MVLISGSSDRAIVDLEQGDYEEMDQLNAAKPFAKAAFRVNRPQDVGIGLARAIRAAVSGRPGGVYLDLTAESLRGTVDTAIGAKSLVKVVDPAPAHIPAPASIQRALNLLAGAQRPLIVLGKGAAYAQADARHPLVYRDHRHSLPADVDGEGTAAGRSSAIGSGGAFLRARQGRRGHAGRRPAELAALARQEPDYGRRIRG